MEQETLPVALYQRNKALVGSRSFGGNMRIGDLVRHEGLCEDIGIIVSFRDSEFGCFRCLVYFPKLGKRTTVFTEDLEVICSK